MSPGIAPEAYPFFEVSFQRDWFTLRKLEFTTTCSKAVNCIIQESLVFGILIEWRVIPCIQGEGNGWCGNAEECSGGIRIGFIGWPRAYQSFHRQRASDNWLAGSEESGETALGIRGLSIQGEIAGGRESNLEQRTSR